MDNAISVEEKKWREEDDARTLARAEIIKADKSRHAGAVRGARRLIEEEKKDVTGLNKVINQGKSSNKQSVKDNSRTSSFNVFTKI